MKEQSSCEAHMRIQESLSATVSVSMIQESLSATTLFDKMRKQYRWTEKLKNQNRGENARRRYVRCPRLVKNAAQPPAAAPETAAWRCSLICGY